MFRRRDSVESKEAQYLPIVIWIKVFSLLPVKSLLIVRTVCTFFLRIINEDYDEFTRFYLSNYLSNIKESRILTVRPRRLHDETQFHAHCEVVEHESNAASAELKWRETSSLFANRKWFVAGSLDGLVWMTPGVEGDTLFALLWNPSIRKARRIPCPTNKPNPMFTRVGFGYDDSCSDYKALAVVDHTLPPIILKEPDESGGIDFGGTHIPKMKEDESGAWVYSVKTGCWTSVELPTCRCRSEISESLSFKGGLVWIEGVDTGKTYYHHLARFDFATHEYSYIPTPYPIKKNVWVTSRLVVLDGGSSLGLWGLGSDNIVSLWTLDDASAAWTRLSNIGELGVLQMRCFRNKEMTWEYWTKCPKLKASIYNNESNLVTDACVEPVEYVDAYVETLVLLNN